MGLASSTLSAVIAIVFVCSLFCYGGIFVIVNWIMAVYERRSAVFEVTYCSRLHNFRTETFYCFGTNAFTKCFHFTCTPQSIYSSKAPAGTRQLELLHLAGVLSPTA